jgi:hypothetical protein
MRSITTNPEVRLVPAYPEGAALYRCAPGRPLPRGRSCTARPETDTGAPAAWGAAEAPGSIPVALDR